MKAEDRIGAALELSGLDVVVVPGLNDSGPAHWQTDWCSRFPQWKRVRQQSWERGDLDAWIGAIAASLAQCRRPAVLVAHSFGALASAQVAASLPERIAAALLVAPAAPQRFGVEERLPQRPLPVPSLLLASRNDPWLAHSGAVELARLWGSTLVDLGEAGHVNADSGYGPWPAGLEALEALLSSLAPRRGDKAIAQCASCWA